MCIWYCAKNACFFGNRFEKGRPARSRTFERGMWQISFCRDSFYIIQVTQVTTRWLRNVIEGGGGQATLCPLSPSFLVNFRKQPNDPQFLFFFFFYERFLTLSVFQIERRHEERRCQPEAREARRSWPSGRRVQRLLHTATDAATTLAHRRGPGTRVTASSSLGVPGGPSGLRGCSIDDDDDRQQHREHNYQQQQQQQQQQ